MAEKKYIGKTSLAEFYNYQAQLIDSGYNGVDLTKKCKVEIGQTNPWTWVNQRVQANDYECFNPADFIPTQMTEPNNGGEHTYNMRIIGMDTHVSPEDSIFGHIDFMSDVSYGGNNIQWKADGNNNGNANSTTTKDGVTTSNVPYLVSALKKFYDETVYPALPQELQDVISGKANYLEARYKAPTQDTEQELLTDSTGFAWVSDMGKVWAPTEVEMFGQIVWGTPVYSAGLSIQYPLFRSNKFRPRYYWAGNTTSTDYHWLATPVGGRSDRACYVSYNGLPDWDSVDYLHCAPLCFRILRSTDGE